MHAEVQGHVFGWVSKMCRPEIIMIESTLWHIRQRGLRPFCAESKDLPKRGNILSRGPARGSRLSDRIQQCGGVGRVVENSTGEGRGMNGLSISSHGRPCCCFAVMMTD